MIRTLNLKPAKERSLLNFHPWVFSGAVSSAVKDIPDGEVVDVMSFDGRFLGRGHFTMGSIMVRLLTFQQENIDAAFFASRINQALSVRLASGFPSDATTAFRLIHGEGDGLPGLVIDIYNNCAVIQTHTTGMSFSVEMIAQALQSAERLKLKTIYFKSAEGQGKKEKQGGAEGWILGDQSSGEVLENGHRFYIDWVNGQKTGFFLDQRENRALLARYSKDKKVLNTFCYSGGFSVYALKAGATFVDSVDSSAKAIEWTDKNIELNGPGFSNHASHVADVFDFLKSKGNNYDVIVLDPPAFAKRLNAVDQAVIGYRNLNFDAISRIKPGGILFTFSCSQAVDTLLFRKTVFTAAAKARRPVRILHQLTQGPDHPVSLYHPEGEYLKGLVLRVD
jgi:23S rRNA (cytosine1962-C5)-methyltransferase